jgi:hypothetical protein
LHVGSGGVGTLWLEALLFGDGLADGHPLEGDAGLQELKIQRDRKVTR